MPINPPRKPPTAAQAAKAQARSVARDPRVATWALATFVLIVPLLVLGSLSPEFAVWYLVGATITYAATRVR